MKSTMNEAISLPRGRALLLAACVLAGCSSLAPDAKRPASPVPGALPGSSQNASENAVRPAWPTLVRSEATRKLIELALAHNRDLRVATLNLEKARAQADVSGADRWPTLNAAVLAQRAPNTNTGQQTNTFQAGLQVSSYELDLWGRVRDANRAAQANLLASEASRRATELGVVAGVASAYLSLVADEEQLALARRTLATREESLRLTRLRTNVGAAAEPELRTAQSLVAQSRANIAQIQRQRQGDESALAVLIGQPVPAELRPPAPGVQAGSALLEQEWLAPVAAGTRSEVLLERPDLLAAEQQLAAAQANIGVARAAFFPRLTLTGSAGQVSSELSDLFQSGHFAWSLAAQAAVALFDAGRNRANVRVAEAQRDIAVAQYEKAIQSAFKETSDAIVGLDSWREQLAAQRDQLDNERERARLSRLRYERGAASALEWLDSERSLYATEQAVIQTRLAELQNRLALYKALGGWPEEARTTP